jgi:hypothetical protein
MTTTLNIPDGEVLAQTELDRMMARSRALPTCGFKQSTRFCDFEAYGKPFTQAMILFEPETPLVVDGKKVVVIASEGGSDNGRAFVRDYTGKEGLGPYLAKRGVTFMTMCRLGRWNFLTDEPLGSWKNVPIETRMPIYHRGQKQHWPADQFTQADAKGVSSPTGSTMTRLPVPGSELEQHSMALTPMTSMIGFETGIRTLLDPDKRDDILLLYYGFSTGGTFLWALTNRVTPNGVLGYGSASFPIGYFSSRVIENEYRWLYDPSAFRVRMRGLTDFTFFNKELPEKERLALWEDALHAPRFKSHEDTFMFFNVAALTEAISRLWNARFLPADVRRRGYAALLKDNLDLCFPGAALGKVAALELFGVKDEILVPKTAKQAASVVRPYCRAFTQAFLPGYHHAVSADHVEAFAAVWLEAVFGGYFHGRRRG